MANLYIISGLPFAGKSLLAREMQIVTGAQVVSFDQLWQLQERDNKALTYEQNIKLIENKLREILASGKSAIYDSTNLKEEHRTNFAKLAQSVGAEPVVVYLDVPVKIIKERRAQSLLDKTHHVVSDENFDNALERLEPPRQGIILRTEADKRAFIDSIRLKLV